MKFEKFFWGYYRGFKAWFYRENGGWGVYNALIVRLSAVGLLVSCLLLLLVYYLHLLYSVMWCLYMQGLRRLYYVVSIYANNVYYVTRTLIYFYDTYIIDFVLSALTGIMRGQPQCLMQQGFEPLQFWFFSIFLLPF